MSFRKFRKSLRNNLAVTELIGIIIMLGISTSSFTVVYFNVVSAPVPNPAPIVEISGMMDNNQVIVTHRGGEPLDLEAEVVFNIGGSSRSFKVGDLLDSESKEDGVWGLSEKLIYPLEYDFDYSEYPKVGISVVDGGSSSLLMDKSVGVNPMCDIGIEVSIDNQFPGYRTNIMFTITVTNNGNINESGIKIIFDKPSELYYYSNKVTQGLYNYSSGVWDVGFLIPGQSEILIVEFTVGDRGSIDDTQLVMLLDGSGSISSGDWTLQLEGLAAAIENNETFPHDSSVELTIIQFGGGSINWPYAPGYAKLEIGPVVINEANYAAIANTIRNINQLNQMTPTACSIYMGADTIVKSSFFDPNIRQVIMMVTDGDPTQGCNCDGDYIADEIDPSSSKKPEYKLSAEAARDYLITTLGMTIDQDEFNAIAVGESTSHASWMKEKIVWPQPSYYAPPFIISGDRRGWLRNVSTWEEFAQSIDESFGVLFNQVPVRVEISDSSLIDPKKANDFSDIVVIPSSSPIVITKPATNVIENNVTFNMYYNFKWIESGDVRFCYQIPGVDWLYTPWEPRTGAGYYSKGITGLVSNTDYIYRAQLRYDDDSVEKLVNVKAESFKTETDLHIAMS